MIRKIESGERLIVSLRGIHRVKPGEAIGICLDPQFAHVFDAQGDALA